jgi:hypothetical protein
MMSLEARPLHATHCTESSSPQGTGPEPRDHFLTRVRRRSPSVHPSPKQQTARDLGAGGCMQRGDGSEEPGGVGGNGRTHFRRIFHIWLHSWLSKQIAYEVELLCFFFIGLLNQTHPINLLMPFDLFVSSSVNTSYMNLLMPFDLFVSSPVIKFVVHFTTDKNTSKQTLSRCYKRTSIIVFTNRTSLK